MYSRPKTQGPFNLQPQIMPSFIVKYFLLETRQKNPYKTRVPPIIQYSFTVSDTIEIPPIIRKELKTKSKIWFKLIKLQGNQKSKMLPVQYVSIFRKKELSHMQSGFFQEQIVLFSVGIGVAPLATSEFNYSNFKSHSCVTCYQTKNPKSL